MFDNEEIDKIVSVLQNGGLAIMPTDTIWGLCCDAFHEKAVQRITTLTNLPEGEKGVLLVSDNEQLEQYIQQIPPKTQSLLDFHTRPLTIVYSNPKGLPAFLLAADGSIAFRVVKDDYCRQIIKTLGRPIIGCVPHVYGSDLPSHYNEIEAELLDKVDIVSIYRRNDESLNSLSVMVEVSDDGELIFLRK